MPLSKVILFESNPTFACNTYPVYIELKKRMPDYKMVWVSHECCITRRGEKVIYAEKTDLLNRIKYYVYINRCRAMISCNRKINKVDERQISLFLCHGSKTKKTRGTYTVGKDIDYVNVQSHFFDDVVEYEYNCDKSKLVYLGYPRCDYFFTDIDNVITREKIIKMIGKPIEKFFVWLPTFRKNKNSDRTDSKNSLYDKIGMPLVYSREELLQFDDFLSENEVHIIFKPHPAQDISMLIGANCHNIHIVFDGDLEKANLQLYQLMAESIALITDYSSVYYDYLLLNRPIATTTDDIDSWKDGCGFAFDLDALYDESTSRIANIRELEKFIVDVVSGVDKHYDGRRRICELTNMYTDGESAKRVADFIEAKLKEKEKKH